MALCRTVLLLPRATRLARKQHGPPNPLTRAGFSHSFNLLVSKLARQGLGGWERVAGGRKCACSSPQLSAACVRPRLADQLILRCDSPKQAISFSVLIDPAKKLVLQMGFGSKVETDQFADTVISATNKEAASGQNLIIDRVTGQFQLTRAASGEGAKGGEY